MNPDSNYIVIAADDLGRSGSVNHAILKAHDQGVVTAAGIMAGGDAFQEAARAVLGYSGLSIGLHVTLCDGKSVLPHANIPTLTDKDGFFIRNPAKAWLSFGREGVISEVRTEVEAQLDRLDAAGIRPSYIDSHHHLHMHPRVFETVCRLASKRGIHWIRIPNEPASVAFGLRSKSRGLMPFVEWAVFRMLRIKNQRTASKYGLHCATRVYGLSRTGDLDEQYLHALLVGIAGQAEDDYVIEIFSHPDSASESGMRELQALTSADIVARLQSLGVRCVGYKDIKLPDPAFSAGIAKSGGRK